MRAALILAAGLVAALAMPAPAAHAQAGSATSADGDAPRIGVLTDSLDEVVARGDVLTDYDPISDEWNGMASLVRLAEGVAQLEVVPVATLEWGDLDAEDILLLIYPQRRVEPGALSAFIAAGGNAIIADDFGQASDAMFRLDMLRAEPTTVRATRFHDNQPFAPIARPLAVHALARDVEEVVTNHPSVLTNIRGAVPVIGFDAGQVVVAAGERGSGRFVVVSDPSIFINRMQQFPGNLQLTANMLRWLGRDGRARRIVLVRGDVPMFGQPRAFIDDANASRVGRGVADLNRWLGDRSDWLLSGTAMRIIPAVLAVGLVLLVLTAMPVRRTGARPDGGWLRLGRPTRRDAPAELIALAERGGARANFVTAACVLRDVAQGALGRAVELADPLHARGEQELTRLLRARRGDAAAAALAKVYPRLRALPSRSLAAAAWGGGRLSRREFDVLHDDVAALCRTLGEPLGEAPSSTSPKLPKLP